MASRKADQASELMSAIRERIFERIEGAHSDPGIHMHTNMSHAEIRRRFHNKELRAFVRKNKFEWNKANRTRFVGAPRRARRTQRDIMNLDNYDSDKKSGLDPNKYQGYIPVYDLGDMGHGPCLGRVCGNDAMIILVASERVRCGGDGTTPLEPGFVYDSARIKLDASKLPPGHYYQGREYTIVSLAKIPHIMFVSSLLTPNPARDLLLFPYMEPHDKNQIARALDALGFSNPPLKASILVKYRFGKYNKQERIANIIRDAKRLAMTIEKYRRVQKGRGGGRNPWMEHLMRVHAKTGLPLKEAMRVASRSWRRRDG